MADLLLTAHLILEPKVSLRLGVLLCHVPHKQMDREGQQSNNLYSSTVLVFLLSIIVKSTSGSDMESLSPAFPEPNSEICYYWRADSRIEADIARAEANRPLHH